MAIARARLVDLSVARWYHCISRCVRRASLLGEGPVNRKAWIEHRLEELSQIFAVTVGGFAVLDNHLHVLVRLDPEAADGWSDEDVVRRRGQLIFRRDQARRVLPVSEQWVQDRLGHPAWVANARTQLKSLSVFMKCLKEPFARLANRQDKLRGAFFEERFKSIAIVDEEALLAIAVYIDLNPVAAGLARRRKPASILRSSNVWTTLRARAVSTTWPRLRTAAWPVRSQRAASRNRTGCARSRIGAGWTRRVQV